MQLIGVVHLPPLPGAPSAGPPGAATMQAVVARALRDARALADGGFDGIVVENYGDAPFFRDAVPPETVAALAVAARAVRDAVPDRVAVLANVLRNDALAALGVAAAAGLQGIRVNVLCGAAVTDQGLVEGRAAEVLRKRAALCPDVRIFADVRVKHAAPLAPRPLADEVRDLASRGGADAILVTGSRTGAEADPAECAAAKGAAGRCPVYVASGVTAATVRGFLERVDGVIVGTALKEGGRTAAPVDPELVRAFVAAARG